MVPSISTREYIRWLPEQASEPTSTVVLTSANNRFVDIRILRPTQDKHVDEDSERNEASYNHNCERMLIMTDIHHLDRLEWAFAGTSESAAHADPQGKLTVHSKWHHWVDSRHNDAEGVTDEGDMFPQANGQTLEVGSMTNPATGRMTEYEECWNDVDPIVTSSGDDGNAKKVCAVLQLHDDAHEVRGMVARVGQYCQGILRAGSELSLERWKWDEQGGWKRQIRMGDLWVPCGVVLDGQRLKMGGEVKFGQYLWKVVELSEF